MLARSAYLDERPPDTGACHTPRGLGMQERALATAMAHLPAPWLLENWIIAATTTRCVDWAARQSDLVTAYRPGGWRGRVRQRLRRVVHNGHYA